MLAAAGFDTVAVDQTTQEQRRMGLHTASVIVPGLVPLDFGWSRQRVLHSARLRAIASAGPNLAPHPFP
jgi:ribosomal protein S12 methylthiotransferase accessory factor